MKNKKPQIKSLELILPEGSYKVRETQDNLIISFDIDKILSRKSFDLFLQT